MHTYTFWYILPVVYYIPHSMWYTIHIQPCLVIWSTIIYMCQILNLVRRKINNALHKQNTISNEQTIHRIQLQTIWVYPLRPMPLCGLKITLIYDCMLETIELQLECCHKCCHMMCLPASLPLSTWWWLLFCGGCWLTGQVGAGVPPEFVDWVSSWLLGGPR